MRARLLVTACFFHFILGSGHAAELDLHNCRLVQERLEKYDALLDDLVFMDPDSLQRDRDFFSWYQRSVSLEVLSGELDRLRDARDVLDRLCR